MDHVNIITVSISQAQLPKRMQVCCHWWKSRDSYQLIVCAVCFDVGCQPTNTSAVYIFSSALSREQEHRYFQVFCLQTASKLSGRFSSTLWQTLTLQTCMRNGAAIRQAIVAIGPLNFTLTTPSDSENESLNPSRRFAFQEYSHAISQIKQRLAGKG